MVLSPQDIHDKEFSTKMRGYNIDEVNDFLDQIIKDYQLILKENNDLKSENSIINKKLKYFDSVKDSLNQSIIVAQEAADKLKKNSEKNAKEITEEAMLKSRNIINQANEKANKVIDNSSKQTKKLIMLNNDIVSKNDIFVKKIKQFSNDYFNFVNNFRIEDVASNLKSSLDDANNFVNNIDISNVNSIEYDSEDSSNDNEIVFTNNSNEVMSTTFYPDGTFKNN
ncbi:DivIVA domain-containing protein [Apilactobacillus sp. TMW 2.2459]|uniref:DivIVA domain-containing protein n=1 Tax=Apilactobacillus xinyiensis TaxID=2841032 RepID=UPI001C7D7BD7|nr:DivIVA domain-containing protein [Apilactobacillus xinyiensis]MCL0312412.1 DivIVA domain-containing protein [Apilactobacillus xinyiensis]